MSQEKSALAPNEEQEEAVTASQTAPAATDEPAPWPDDAAESAFLLEQREADNPAGGSSTPKADGADSADDATPLPPMQELIDRIPPQARETLEDLFRAKFIAVRRASPDALKKL
ncbi:hypothetical protein DB347_16345 [Opitutaceae bacterium EW11]|nr:hypothetical protein DB347_16345 [Opitutaceae bacterium EW11]